MSPAHTSGGSNAASSAYRAGLQPGDLVISINGGAVTDAEQIDRTVIASKIGSTVKLEVIRDGRRVTLSVPVVSRQQQTAR